MTPTPPPDPTKPPPLRNGPCAAADASVIHPWCVSLSLSLSPVPVWPAGAVLRMRGLEASSPGEGGRGRSGVCTQRGRRERVQEVQQPLPGR